MAEPEELTLRYVPLDECRRWPSNPKTHDLDKLQESMRRHGFVDPAKFDTALGALVYGNGRTEALEIMRDAGEEPPRGVHVDESGVWMVPVQYGVDQESRQMAEALAVDHNSLTAAGLPVEQVALMFDAELLAELMGGENAPELLLDLASALADVEPPDEFPDVDENLPTEHQCPECGYKWSGGG